MSKLELKIHLYTKGLLIQTILFCTLQTTTQTYRTYTVLCISFIQNYRLNDLTNEKLRRMSAPDGKFPSRKTKRVFPCQFALSTPSLTVLKSAFWHDTVMPATSIVLSSKSSRISAMVYGYTTFVPLPLTILVVCRGRYFSVSSILPFSI